MPFLRKLFHLFIFSSIYIALGAALMAWQAGEIFGFRLSTSLLGFIFCGTLCSYNFHWFLSPPDTEAASPKSSFTSKNRELHIILAMAGFAGAVFFGFMLREHIVFLLTTAVFTFLYSAPKIPLKAFAFLKRIAIGKTIFLAAAWTHVTAVLPFLVSGEKTGSFEMVYFFNRFFFIYSICILFDYRDREEDKKQQVRSLVTWLDEKGINRLFFISILLFFFSLGVLSPVLSFTELALLALPAFPLSLLYSYFKRNTSDVNFYFILDGLMILSAPLLVLAKFAR